MRKLWILFQFFHILSQIQFYSCEDAQNLLTGEAFFTTYLLNRTKIGPPDELDVVATVRDFPDLPKWMHYFRRSGSDKGYFYGTPGEDGDLDIEIVITNLLNMSTSKDRLKYRIETREKIGKFEVKIKFFELDLQDVFERNIMPALLDIFRNQFEWNKGDLYVSKFARLSQVGGRLPLDPTEKEGVILHIASTANFTTVLQQLANEVEPIRNRNPCPKRYKASSAEYLFREQSLHVDWCQFHLLQLK